MSIAKLTVSEGKIPPDVALSRKGGQARAAFCLGAIAIARRRWVAANNHCCRDIFSGSFLKLSLVLIVTLKSDITADDAADCMNNDSTDNNSDRRRTQRTAFGKQVVQVEAADRAPIMACLWDLSEDGACLLFAADIHVPDTFKINFDDVPRLAQVMWRREAFVGVRFTDTK